MKKDVQIYIMWTDTNLKLSPALHVGHFSLPFCPSHYSLFRYTSSCVSLWQRVVELSNVCFPLAHKSVAGSRPGTYQQFIQLLQDHCEHQWRPSEVDWVGGVVIQTDCMKDLYTSFSCTAESESCLGHGHILSASSPNF